MTIDGKPVRARCFSGAPGTQPLPLTKAGQGIEFEFSCRDDEPARSTMHFRFGNAPGDVSLTDIRVRDLDARQDILPTEAFASGMDGFHRCWNIWPPDRRNTVGSVAVAPGNGPAGSATLHVAIRTPADGNWPDFHIYHQANLCLRKGHRYRVTLWGRADPPRGLTVAFYRPGDPYVFLGGPPGAFESQIRLAATSGVDLVSFPLDLPWPKPGEEPRWSTVDAQCQTVLDANPPRDASASIGADAPAWWLVSHADDAMVWDLPGADQMRAVVTSPEYLRDATRRLADLVAHVESKFGPHVAGYHPCGQNTGEWFYQNTWDLPLNGYSQGDRRAWRAWLADRYASDAALQAAWNDPRAARATAAVPSPAARRAAPAGVFRDPRAERPLIDFAQFQQEAMAQCVCRMAHAVREATHGRKLVVFFYGYLFEFGPVRNGPATSGHYALRRVLDCPDIDVLCSPISYTDRGLGQSGPAMTAAESVALAGKMWLYEDDTSTFLSDGMPPGSADRVRTIDETNNLLLRNTSQCALRNFGTWWMDLGASGWFNDPRMWAQMKRLGALDDALLATPRPYRPEVAAVIDEANMLRVAAGGQVVTDRGVSAAHPARPHGRRLTANTCSTTWPPTGCARMYVFLNAWSLPPQQLQRLLAAIRSRLRVWCYAPGWCDGQQNSLDAMRTLTGFHIRQLHGVRALAQPTPAGRKLGLRQSFGVAMPIEPLFAAADATAEETLATYTDGSAAVALRNTADGPSLFVGPPGLTSELLRVAARRAGVHLFTQDDCNVYANGRLPGFARGAKRSDRDRHRPSQPLARPLQRPAQWPTGRRALCGWNRAKLGS